MKRLAWILWAAALLPVACSHPKDLTLEEGAGWSSRRQYADFVITGQARTEEGAVAAIRFCESAPGAGYEVLLQNGPIDGTVKTGSLSHVRNLYRSLAQDGEWFDFSVAVRGKNIGVQVNGKLRATIHIAKDESKENVLEAARIAADKRMTGTVVKEIYVPQRIVNIVVK
jgi:hypothetical protein